MITSYEELPVGAYCKIMAALAEEGASDNDKTLALLSVLTGKTTDELLDEPLEQFRKENAAGAFVLVYPVPHKVQDAYTLKGVRYLPTLLERKMTAGQFIDFNEYASRKDADNLWAEILSVILVPEGKTYGKGYDVAEVQEAIREELCILDAIALRAFFLTSCGQSARDTLPSLAKAMKAMRVDRRTRERTLRQMRIQARALQANGAGWRTLMRWLKLPDAVGMMQRASL